MIKSNRVCFVVCASVLILLAQFSVVFINPLSVEAAGEIEISTWEDLANMSSDLDGDYILMNDLGPLDAGYDTYASSSANGGTGWDPIGADGSTPFTGSFDGQGFTISGININSNTYNNGLFGYVIGGTIRDVTLADFNITLSESISYAGFLAGQIEGAEISGFNASGTITGQASYVGGIAGTIIDMTDEVMTRVSDSGTEVTIDVEGTYVGGISGSVSGSEIEITNVNSIGSISADAYAGGLFGNFDDAMVRNSYSSAEVTIANNMGGGLIGYIDRGLVYSSYSLGDVTGNYDVGGLIGRSWYGIIADTYAYGAVSHDPVWFSDVGALIGEADMGALYSITSSAWNADANPEMPGIDDGQDGLGVTGLTEEEFNNAASFESKGWDFDNIWHISSGPYPVLRTNALYFEGEGNEGSPYMIETCNQLQNVRIFPSNDFKLANDIDCSDSENWNDGIGFLGIAYPYEGHKFSGTFDGDNHTISGLFMNSEFSDYTGLFRYIDAGAEVRDLTITDAYIHGDDFVGVLAGGLSGVAENITAQGVVEGDYTVGGLVGVHANEYGLNNSSPLVYTWDGDSYEYVADVGEMIARGTDGEDYAVIDEDKIAPKDDVYSIKISQEYNEIVYYDKLSLMEFEHEPGYTVVEPMLRSAGRDTLTTVSDTPTHPLLSCVDMYGNNCLDDLKAYDDKWSYRDDSEVNEWILDFGDLSNAERIQLVVRAARNYEATPDYDHRTISVMGPDGEWVQIYGRKELGSDGTPRLRTIDLTGKFLTDDYRIKFGFDRLRANMFAVDTTPEQSFTAREIQPSKAELSFRGYTTIDSTYFNDHKYDEYSAVPPVQFANQIGNFTKYGDVLPLLLNAEDHMVIMRHGDHMDLEFPYTDPTPGKEVSYILFNDVVYKHASEKMGYTVNPLPYQGMKSYPDYNYPMTPQNEEYLRTWNTRVYSGPIPGGSTIISSSADVDVKANYLVGGLVGRNEKLITDSSATGYVGGVYSNIGGLVGYSDGNSEIIRSYSNNELSEDSGFMTVGQAGVEGDCSVGGLAGSILGGSNVVNSYTHSNVYSSGDCAAASFAGEASQYAAIINSYSSGQLLYNGSPLTYKGGFLGISMNLGITNSFWNTDANPELVSCGQEIDVNCDTENAVVGKTLSELRDRNTYTTALGEGSWDFDTVWGINSINNNSLPFLQTQNFESEDPEPEPAPEPERRRRSSSVRSRVSNLKESGQVEKAEDLKKQYPGIFNNESNNTSSTQTNTSNTVTTVRDLEIGMTGEDVKQLQNILITLNYSIPAGATGYFGTQTQSALIRYQKENAIVPAIGYFGPLTRAQMKSSGISGVWW